jgi:hypothetical protein
MQKSALRGGCCSLLAQRWLLLLFLDACRRCRPRLLVSALLEGKAWTREPSPPFHGPCHVAAEVTRSHTLFHLPKPAAAGHVVAVCGGWVVQQREMVCGNMSEGSRYASAMLNLQRFCICFLRTVAGTGIPSPVCFWDAAGSGVEMMPMMMMMSAFSHNYWIFLSAKQAM